MTAFARLLKSATEPTSAGESYRRLAGVLPAIAPGDCGGGPTRFEVSGDPVYGSGCLDGNPADRRMLISTGPFDLAPGDSQHVVLALIVGGVPDGGARLTNLRRLRQYVVGAREALRRDFTDVPDLPEADPGPLLYLGQAGTPLPFDAGGSRDADGTIADYAWDFGDGQTGSGVAAPHTYAAGGIYDVTLTVTDDDGNTMTARTRADVYEPGVVTPSFADATFQGVVNVEYLNLDVANRHALEGVPWGGRYFGGGFDTGCRWMGSTLVPTDDDLTLCPGATISPRSFTSIEIRFQAGQNAYRFFRRELASGAEPAAGRGYTFQGRGPVPFLALGVLGDRQIPLEVLYTERQVTNDAGSPVGPQPASQNATWMPAADDSGGHEYIEILALPYSFTARPELSQDGVFASGTLPVLYGGWLRLRGASDVVDPLDRIAIRWGDLAGLDGDTGADWADADGDGDLDLAITNFQGRSRVFRNDGAGEFSDWVFPPVPITTDKQPAPQVSPLGLSGETSATWADVDNDGDLDLFMVGNGRLNRLFRNLDGVFLEATPGAAYGNGLGTDATWVDDDRDGDLDLYLGQTDGNVLLRNGGGTLVEATPTLLAGEGRPRWADVDGDGDLDLYLVSGGPDRLVRNDGAGAYTDITSGPIGELGGGRDGAFGDFDGDGDPDFILANLTGVRWFVNAGGAFTEAVAPALAAIVDPLTVHAVDFDGDADLDLLVTTGAGRQLMRNDAGVFADATSLLPVSGSSGWGAAAGDFDADGDVDFYVPSEADNELIRNDTPRVRFLRLSLRGQISNRFAVGARVRVVAGGATQVRDVAPDDVLPLVFGLGGAAIVDTVEVRWPSGIVERRTDVAVFSDLTLTEGNTGGGLPTRLAFGRITPNPARGPLVFELRFPAGPAVAKLGVFDVAGRRVWHRDVIVAGAGVQLIAWDGNDDDGHEVPSAVYFARIEGPGGDASRRFVRIK
jgi:PKD repeat protein